MQNLTMQIARHALEEALDTFQWSFPDRGENRGEIKLNDDDTLTLVVWCLDNEDETGEELHPLDITMAVDPTLSARTQIRLLIHTYLTHEADEQMWFADERPFYPHEKAKV